MKEFREKYKETIKRAIRTFVQAAIGYVAAHLLYVLPEGANADTMKSAFMGVTVCAIAAGLAAAMNLPKEAASIQMITLPAGEQTQPAEPKNSD